MHILPITKSINIPPQILDQLSCPVKLQIPLFKNDRFWTPLKSTQLHVHKLAFSFLNMFVNIMDVFEHVERFLRY